VNLDGVAVSILLLRGDLPLHAQSLLVCLKAGPSPDGGMSGAFSLRIRMLFVVLADLGRLRVDLLVRVEHLVLFLFLLRIRAVEFEHVLPFLCDLLLRDEHVDLLFQGRKAPLLKIVRRVLPECSHLV